MEKAKKDLESEAMTRPTTDHHMVNPAPKKDRTTSTLVNLSGLRKPRTPAGSSPRFTTTKQAEATDALPHLLEATSTALPREIFPG